VAESRVVASQGMLRRDRTARGWHRSLEASVGRQNAALSDESYWQAMSGIGQIYLAIVGKG
jgi:hypothetical protein